MKKNKLQEVELPPTWGQIKIGKEYYVWKPKPSIPVSEISRIMINILRRYKRDDTLTPGTQALVIQYANDLRKALRLRGRSHA
jgi:hypothetical protein